MGTYQNKTVAVELLYRLSRGDFDGADSLLSDEATWRIVGKPDRFPAARLYRRNQILPLFRAMLDQLSDGLIMTITGLIAEADRVAIEATSQGDLKNGRQYRQDYHFLLTMRHGKVTSVREHLDTQHAYDVWVSPES